MYEWKKMQNNILGYNFLKADKQKAILKNFSTTRFFLFFFFKRKSVNMSEN